MALASCFRPACAVAVRLAAVSPSAGVVAFRLGRGAVLGGSRARWPSFPASVWAAWPLAALCFASPRRAVVRLPALFRARGAPPGAVVGGCSGVWSGVGSAGAFLAAANAVFFSPLTTPLFSPWRWRAAMRSISVRGAKISCAPVRPLAGRLSCGRGPRLGCVRGRRAWAVVLPPLACALRLPRRVLLPRPSARVAPVVWLAGFGGEGCFVLQRPHAWGTGTRRWRSDRRHERRFSRNPAHRPQGGGFTRACTQKFVYKKSPTRKILAGDGGERLPPAKQGGMKHKIP